MSVSWRKSLVCMLVILAGIMSLGALPISASGEVTLFTPYTNITVPPGESINYSIDVINNTDVVQNASLTVDAPQDWNVELTTGGWNIEELGVKPNSERSVNLDVEVPLQVDKGEYEITVMAEGMASLPLRVTISEKGIFRTELTTDQPNMQGHADSNFNFSLDLRNRTAEEQLYALQSSAPQGWNVIFKVSGKQVTSATIEANQSQTVNVEMDPPVGVKADTYTIPISASNGTTGAETELEVVVTGSYGMQLTTPTGLLSTDVTAGNDSKVELEIRNTGSAELQDITMDYVSPVGWDVSYEPKTIEKLAAGKTAQVIATINSSDQSIPGDYVTSMTARTQEVTSQADFRIAVKTSVLWGWLGIIIILVVIGGVTYLFRKYGRR